MATTHASAPAMSWDRFEHYGGEMLTRDVQGFVRGTPRDALVRRFFEWLLMKATFADLLGDVGKEIISVATMYRMQTRDALTEQEASSLVASVVSQWLDYEVQGKRSPDYRRRAQAEVTKLLGNLGKLPARGYPSFSRSLLRSPPTPKNDRKIGLAHLDWPSLSSLPPGKRDEHALSEVRAAALLIFERAEVTLGWGRAVISASGPPDHVDQSAWYTIKNLITSVEDELRSCSTPSLRHDFWSAREPRTWSLAGYPLDLPSHTMHTRTVQRLIFHCIAATIPATAAAKIIFCCDTGWNSEQITELPRDPYAFRSNDHVGLADRAFLAAYKARANHFVHALLERQTLERLSPHHQMAIWEEEAQHHGGEGFVLLPRDNSTIAILDRFERMAAPAREFDRGGQFADHFFVAISQRGFSLVEETLRVLDLGGILSCDGFGYVAIRKSRINSVRRATGSLEKAKFLTDHTRTRTIVTHYDDASIAAELDESVRFFLNCLQVEILETETASGAERLGLSKEDVEWFKHLCIVCGLSAAFHVQERRLSAYERRYLEFTPTDEALAEIYLIRRAALALRKTVGGDRWRVQVLPILGVANALRRHAFQKGHGAWYANVVKHSYAQVRDDKIDLPPILGF